MPKEIDLKGKVFGRWTVLERDFSNPGSGARWICQCSCDKHTIKSVKGQSLRNGRSKSCGCLQKEIAASSKIDLTGQIFGKLTVLYQDIVHSDEAYWICRCECGSITQPIRGSSLKNGHTTSCGCLNSTIELKIQNILNELNIKYKKQYSFSDLRGKKDKLRFDFAIFKNDELYALIEYQGEQHYKSEEYFGGDEKFLEVKEYDKRKKDYCKKNNIFLIEIPYWEKQKISKNYILDILLWENF